MTRFAARFGTNARRLTVCVAALACVAGCGSSDEHEHAVRAGIIDGYLDTMTHGVVALATADDGRVRVFCSGSLIAPNLVLTARHCIAQIGDGSSEQVSCTSSRFTAEYDAHTVFVSTDAEPETSMGELYSVDRILEAPGKTDVCGFDVALLVLSGAGVPSASATPIVPELTSTTTLHTPFSAIGYGLQRADDEQGVTVGRRMRFDSAYVYCIGDSCPTSAQNATDEWVGNSPVCSGDSGGPALSNSGRVFGVTSRGPADCSYALYSNVADWAAFIRNTANEAAAAGDYTPPDWATLPSNVPTPDAGTSAPDAGVSEPDAGVSEPDAGPSANDAGTPAAKPPPVGVSTPTVDPLGETCSGSCPGTYQCFSSTSAPPGICVPPCAASGSACPTDYACSASLKVCVPKDLASRASASAACALEAPHAARGAQGWLALLGVIASAWLGRRRRAS